VFDKYLNDNNIDSKLIKQYFKTSFNKSNKKTNSSKRNGYSFFPGIKLIKHLNNKLLEKKIFTYIIKQ
jgi:3-deoxy-D-manno-octulosonic acid (KDO) 8-phosphate synthase